MTDKAQAIITLQNFMMNLSSYSTMLNYKDVVKVCFHKKDKDYLDKEIHSISVAIKILLGSNQYDTP